MRTASTGESSRVTALTALFDAPVRPPGASDSAWARSKRSRVGSLKHARSAVEGLLVHIAGEGDNGFRVVDVWQSEDAFRRFGETLMPIL